MARNGVLAIDVGSVSVALVELDGDRGIARRAHRAHHGRVAEAITNLLSDWPLDNVAQVVATKETPSLVRAAARIDWMTAIVTAHRALSPGVPNLLLVGGERFALVRFDETGHYRSARGNTSCAAGTGGFLDQQAARLGLSGAAELAELAASNTGHRPKVASRCSVFAKTDLIHAQQEGYTLAEICDGLCHGLSRNLLDAVVTGSLPPGDVVMAGGVALNRSVVRHVGSILDREITVTDLAPVYGAYGAALVAAESAADPTESGSEAARATATAAAGPITVADILCETSAERSYYHDPLPEPLDYPDFSSHEHFVHEPELTGGPAVEVDRYRAPGERLYLGIDVGSTSTKAVLMAPDGEPCTAFYTRTAGAPIRALQAILETISATGADAAPIAGAACTGSGRKLVGGVIDADLVLDEISAHARAASDLNPEVDTIIEIGGQDAKFTTLKNGRVTFSQMNAVCAAGTGSFLEEQAGRLGVPISTYADIAIGSAAPLASDRCTVFMERDLNHYVNKGYATEELLAAALHSVRENYLQKVAQASAIGNVVCFQGATAKNRGLVAAFEQRLGKPIAVSRYCHVTGALGAALTCRDEMSGPTSFRGVGLYRADIPLRSERCTLCTNHCRLTIASVGGEEVAYGFLCGRDYQTNSFVSANTSGFDLMATRRKVDRNVARASRGRGGRTAPTGELRVGIPSGLHLAEEHGFWLRVFAELGIRTVVPSQPDVVARGKQLQGAEFCSPVAAFHGQVADLLDRADLVFVPIHLEKPDPDNRKRAYCYYTQFTPSVVKGAVSEEESGRLLTPVLWGGHRDPAQELVRVLEPWTAPAVNDVRRAMRVARDAQEQASAFLRDEYARRRSEDQADVVLLGRPYTALDPSMNKRIPEIFGRHGTRCFYQDMLPRTLPSEASRELIESVHWRYAADILLSADYVSRTPGLYPVFVTSFKCAPDAFCMDAFKRIMDGVDKPYLILQLDEHDSSVGYETRIEAAIRAFRNHHAEAASAPVRAAAPTAASRHAAPVTPRLEHAIGAKTLLFPNWDPITSPLLAANLRGHGINAVLLTETPLSIQKSMRLNTGQCIPVSAIAQEAMDHVRDNGLDPADTVLWMGRADWSCGIPLYPRFLKGVFEQEGMPDLGVYLGDFTYNDISYGATIGAYFAYQFGGWLRRIACRVRPYEVNRGQTDALVAAWRARFETLFEYKGNRFRALRRMAEEFRAVPVRDEKRPKVGVFGDLYVRDNEVMNQDLIRQIEEAGGEAVTTPYSDYVKIIAGAQFDRMLRTRAFGDFARLRLVLAAIERLERRYHREVEDLVGPPVEWRRSGVEDELGKFNMVLDHAGESYENALKILHLVSQFPDISLFVQTSPAFCCPSLVTEALGELVERVTGVPIVTVTYDGTGGDKNGAVVPYIRFARDRMREKTA
ncbi:MAG: acyl-CoA dehydratase activase [Spirochaetota bacterium]